MQQVRGVISRGASGGPEGGEGVSVTVQRSTFTSVLAFLSKGRLCGILLDCTTSGITRGVEAGSLTRRGGGGSGGQRSCALEWLQVLHTIHN